MCKVLSSNLRIKKTIQISLFTFQDLCFLFCYMPQYTRYPCVYVFTCVWVSVHTEARSPFWVRASQVLGSQANHLVLLTFTWVLWIWSQVSMLSWQVTHTLSSVCAWVCIWFSQIVQVSLELTTVLPQSPRVEIMDMFSHNGFYSDQSHFQSHNIEVSLRTWRG